MNDRARHHSSLIGNNLSVAKKFARIGSFLCTIEIIEGLIATATALDLAHKSGVRI